MIDVFLYLAFSFVQKTFQSSDGFGGLVVCQDKARSTSFEHCKQLKKLLMLMSAIVSLLTRANE
jgi:hypothetical protein